jgi:hypothetical protein
MVYPIDLSGRREMVAPGNCQWYFFLQMLYIQGALGLVCVGDSGRRIMIYLVMGCQLN